MIQNSQLRQIVSARKLYRQLLRIYPASHRAEYGEAMEQLFCDLCRDACRSQGWRGLIGLWPHILIEMIQTAFREHIDTIQQRGEFMTRRQWMITVGFSGSPLFLGLILTLMNPAFMGHLIAPNSSPAQPVGWILIVAILVLAGVAGIVQYRIFRSGDAVQGETARQRLFLSFSLAFLVFPAILIVIMGPALVQILAMK
ncbi:MAG: hypothetical protein JXA21_09235 [Anaerolineae bacterium]|nr:hypothetical protein [Anaerolineae bacterium]